MNEVKEKQLAHHKKMNKLYYHNTLTGQWEQEAFEIQNNSSENSKFFLII